MCRHESCRVTDHCCVLHATILVQGDVSARARWCGLFERPRGQSSGGEYAANSKGRYVSTGRIKPSGPSTPAGFTGKMIEHSEPTWHRMSAPSSLCPERPVPPPAAPLLQKSCSPKLLRLSKGRLARAFDDYRNCANFAAS